MINKLIIYRNELKNKNISKYKLIGITSEIILSKEIFKYNKDISPFLFSIFNINFKNYVMKSRTLIIAKVIRLIYLLEDSEVNTCSKQLYTFTNTIIAESKKESNNQFDGWIK